MGSASETQERPQPRDSDTRGIRRIRDAADQPVQAAREMIGKGADAAAQTAGALTDVTRHAANQVAEARPLANASYAHGRRVVDTRAPSLVGYYTQIGRGVLHMQQSYFDVLRRSMEVAEVQRDLYRNAVTTTIEATRTVLQAAAQVAQSAMQPLQGRG